MAQKYEFPFVIRDLNAEEKRILNNKFSDNNPDPVKFVGNDASSSSRIRELGVIFRNFKPRTDDIWLIGYPRSGTTLTQEILYLLENDLNYEKAASEIMDIRFPMLHGALDRNENDENLYENCPLKEKLTVSPHLYLEETKGKRFMKSHYSFSFLHPEILEIGCKVVFIARNIKDVMVSHARYPACASDPAYKFEKTWNLFKYNLVNSSGYFEMLREAWERRNSKNLLILYYEEVNADKRGAILKIAEFLNKKLKDDELEKLLEHIQIDSFKKNKSLNNDHLVDIGLFGKTEEFSFIRKGNSGGWRNEIPPELMPEIDGWIKENFEKMPNFVVPKCWKTAMELDL